MSPQLSEEKKECCIDAAVISRTSVSLKEKKKKKKNFEKFHQKVVRNGFGKF